MVGKSERMENLLQSDTGKTNRSLNSIIIKHLMRASGKSKRKPINSSSELTPFLGFLRSIFVSGWLAAERERNVRRKKGP